MTRRNECDLKEVRIHERNLPRLHLTPAAAKVLSEVRLEANPFFGGSIRYARRASPEREKVGFATIARCAWLAVL